MRDKDSVILENIYNIILENNNIDVEYAELEKQFKKGNKDAKNKAKKMLYDIAKIKKYNTFPVFHGTPFDWVSQDRWIHVGNKKQAQSALRSWDDYDLEDNKKRIISLFVKTINPYISVDREGVGEEPWRDEIDYAENNGYDSIVYKNEYEGKGKSYIVPIGNAKLADVFVYDDNNKLIPLSRRFDSSNNDIRF